MLNYVVNIKNCCVNKLIYCVNNFSMGYDYDAKGNVISLHSTYDWLGPDVITQEFAYDSTDRLITAAGSTESNFIYSNTIDYNNWGKIQHYNIEIIDPLNPGNQRISYTDYDYPVFNYDRTQTLFGAEHSHTHEPNGNPPDVDIEYDFGINGTRRASMGLGSVSPNPRRSIATSSKRSSRRFISGR